MIDMPLARNVDEEDGRHVMNTRGGLGPGPSPSPARTIFSSFFEA